jgi:hypothetical protein
MIIGILPLRGMNFVPDVLHCGKSLVQQLPEVSEMSKDRIPTHCDDPDGKHVSAMQFCHLNQNDLFLLRYL